MKLYRVQVDIFDDFGPQTRETQVAATNDDAAKLRANAWADSYACGLNHSAPVVDPVALPDGVCLITNERKTLLEQVEEAAQHVWVDRNYEGGWMEILGSALAALEKQKKEA